MEVTKDKLPSGLAYPCSIKDVREWLRALPQEDVRGLVRVHLTNRRLWHFQDGEYIGWQKKVVLSYAVDGDLIREFPTKWLPAEDVVSEWRAFGAEALRRSGRWCARWKSAAMLKRYIRFVLFHEIGHKVWARMKRPARSGGEARAKEEEFCDSYARGHLDAVPSEG